MILNRRVVTLIRVEHIWRADDEVWATSASLVAFHTVDWQDQKVYKKALLKLPSNFNDHQLRCNISIQIKNSLFIQRGVAKDKIGLRWDLRSSLNVNIIWRVNMLPYKRARSDAVHCSIISTGSKAKVVLIRISHVTLKKCPNIPPFTAHLSKSKKKTETDVF